LAVLPCVDHDGAIWVREPGVDDAQGA
jgi:hypothetical protein